MDFNGSILILEKDAESRKSLETIVGFLGCEWQSGELEDCLSYLSSNDSATTLVIAGELGNQPVDKLLDENKDVPFIFTQHYEESELPQRSNMIGILGKDGTYEGFLQLLRFCQSFNSLHKKVKKGSNAQTLLKLLVGKGDAICTYYSTCLRR